MTAKDICIKLNIDENLAQQSFRWTDSNKEFCDKTLYLLLKGKCGFERKLDGKQKLALVLNALPYVYAKYQEKGIDEKIFFDTFSDIKIWCDNGFEQYGTQGLENLSWIAKHLSMKIFRIGRLQYEFSRFLILPHAKLKDVIKCPYRLGEKCITLHIPQGEKLDTQKCLTSIKDANAFFEKYYPDYKYRCYTVITWLVNPNLENVLGEDSNIVKFGKLFHILGYVPDSDMNERRVFGYKKDRANYAPKNALQTYTLARIQKNLPLYSYNGYRAK